MYLDYIYWITPNIPIYFSNMTWFLLELLKGELSILFFIEVKFGQNMFQMYFKYTYKALWLEENMPLECTKPDSNK